MWLGMARSMSESSVGKDALFGSLPPIWPRPLLTEIQGRIAVSGQRLVILDDDPTGAQTSHGVPVLTGWSTELLAAEIERSTAFFVLTNSRALDEASAVTRAREIGAALREAMRRTGREVAVASRSDSTLRGHFPAEVDALIEAVWGDDAGGHPHPSPLPWGEGAEHRADWESDRWPTILFVPYFAEGGRFTINDTQYVLQEETLVPAAQTEFARDAAFAYSTSFLPAWVEEKTKGRGEPLPLTPSPSTERGNPRATQPRWEPIRAKDVVRITHEDLRIGGPEAVASKLGAAPAGGVVIANAADDRDIEVLVVGLMLAEAAGKRFLYRTSASFVRVRAGISTRPLLTPQEIRRPGTTGGLVVVGSYIEKTSLQLAVALDTTEALPVEVSVDALLGEETERQKEIANASINASNLLAARRDVVLYTSRGLRRGSSPAESLAIGHRVSTALCEVVAGLMATPRFLIAKGGNTASDLATSALGVQRAVVLGQLLPGAPVWQLGEESKFPGLCYVVFPGNVGEPDGLAAAMRVFG